MIWGCAADLCRTLFEARAHVALMEQAHKRELDELLRKDLVRGLCNLCRTCMFRLPW